MRRFVAVLLAQRALGDGVCTGRRMSVDATITLGQKKHSTYDASHTSNIHELLDNLNLHYPAIHETDLLLWHEVDRHLFRCPVVCQDSGARTIMMDGCSLINFCAAPSRTSLRTTTSRRSDSTGTFVFAISTECRRCGVVHR
jgi:hypothetical protein